MNRLTALLGAVAAAAATASDYSTYTSDPVLLKAAQVIRQDLAPHASTAKQCNGYDCCTISDTQPCPLSALPKDLTTLVFPGGDTRCIESTSTPFAFQVIPGDSDKVLFYFQGGGACWDDLSTRLGLCSTDANPNPQIGVFDRANKQNTFRQHTVISVLYCSGDVHGGNTVRSYDDRSGVPVQQRGLVNAQSALTWVMQQQAVGALAETLTELVIMGCSAGSIGAQLWGKQVLTSIAWQKAAVVPDSYAGVFPPGSQGPLIYNYGFCKSGFLSADLLVKCEAQELSIQDIDLEFIAATPTVPYTFIQSKVDDVQQSFYIALGVTTNSSDPLTNPTEFYNDVNEVFGGYTAQLQNFATYLVDGPHHCFTNQDLYYNADAKGPKDDGQTNEGDMLYEWTNKMPLSDGESISSVCEGAIEGVDGFQGKRGTKVSAGDNNYCSADVIPNTYTEKY